MRVIVAGGGVAGLCAALVLARSGHGVTLVERDPLDAPDDWQAALSWSRKGIPHFHQPHAFLARGRTLMQQLLPDVYGALLAAGAEELRLGRKAPGGELPEDADLVFLAVRRPLIEWALRQAVLREPGVTVHPGSVVVGLVADAGALPHVRGLRTQVGQLDGDLVIDAMGRQTPAPGWLAALGERSPQTESSESNLLYYSRYYQIHPGLRFPEGPWLLSPRGDLGYMSFTSFLGDNNTFAIVLGIPVWDRELRALRRAPAFTAACRAIPLLAPLVDPEFAQPIMPVLPMGSLQNTLRTYTRDGVPLATGMLPVADSYCHTNPAFALGMSMALLHAVAAASALEEHTNPRDQLLAYFAATLPEAAERFRLASATDVARTRLWRGEQLDVTRRDGCYPLFVMVAGGAVATRDPDVFRRVVRRHNFLERTAVLDEDEALLQRIEQLFAELRAAGPPPPAGPPRNQMLELVTAA